MERKLRFGTSTTMIVKKYYRTGHGIFVSIIAQMKNSLS
jgi:hypothetical protein